MAATVIVAGARTPMGRFNGSLASISATDLGGVAIRGALQRAGVPAADVQYVIMGQVLQAGAGQVPARQAARAGGIPLDVPAVTINKMCLSSLDAIALADQLIRAGDVDIVVAGGMESMSRAPHLLPGSRTGAGFGDVTMIDHLAHDGLHDVFTDVPMGQLTETTNDSTPSPASSRTPSLPAPTGGPPPRRPRECSRPRSNPSWSEDPAAASSSTPTRASARTPPSRPWARTRPSAAAWSGSPRSPRTA